MKLEHTILITIAAIVGVHMFLTYCYSDKDDTNNTNEDLIKDLKLSIIMLDETVEGDDTPLDLMFGTRSGGYKDTVIDNVNFEILL